MNGSVVTNLGEKHAEMKTREGVGSFLMPLQAVEVHKPLLAASKLVDAGHKVIFDQADPHILMSSGEKVKMNCSAGTYDIEI